MQTVVPEGLSQEFSLERLRGLWKLSHADVVWRHDIDFDTLAAVCMAEAEAEAGITSTYYVRLRGPYNLFSAEVGIDMDQIATLGHRVGLHLDTGLPRHAAIGPVVFQAIQSQAIREWGLLRREFRWAMTEHEIPVSFHAPPNELRWRTWPFIQAADSAEWEGRYIADSRGVWRCDPEARLMIDEPIQVNLHPEWWFLDLDQREELREQEALKP